MSSSSSSSSSPTPILCASFNQDNSCFAIGTKDGFRIFDTNTGKLCYERAVGAFSIVEMLFTSSLLAIVGAGDQPSLSPRRLCLFNTTTGAPLRELNFLTSILAIRMNRKRLIVILQDKAYVYDINSLLILDNFDTVPNSKGLCAFSPCLDACYMALPASTTKGSALLYNAMDCNLHCEIDAHRSPLAAMVFSSNGMYIATASEQGTLVRVHLVSDATKSYSFRRGSYSSTIFSLSFGPSKQLPDILAATSSSGSIHLFTLGFVSHPRSKRSSGFLGSIIPDAVNDVLDPAYHHVLHNAVPAGVKSSAVICKVENVTDTSSYELLACRASMCVSAPKPPTSMLKSNIAFLPTSPMVYAVIHDPAIVDNPDVPSYQPHVHGKCDPPALIPLQMINAVDLRVDCWLNTAVVEVSGSWRLHCVSGSRSCDCVVAVPMGPQGSILGVEVSVHRKSYSTQLVDLEDQTGGKENVVRTHDGGFLKSNVFTLTIPQIDGGSNLSIKISWSQKITCCNDVFSVNVPFTFPDFVNPAGKRMAKKEKIQLNVNAVNGGEIMCKTTSHPTKEARRDAGSIGFSHDTDVLSWSKFDFNFSYTVSSNQTNGGIILQPAYVDDDDQREMFCMYLSPGNLQSKKVFRKDIVFVIDISGSMRGKLIDDTKNALSAALSKLDPDDSFSIIAFNGEVYQFSTSMELASSDAVERAIEWININFVAGGDTNLLHPLNMAIEMLSDARRSVPIIFLVTDGTVEDERQTCDMIKNGIRGESIFPRIYTLGIGSFCNHYFLRMLAMISRGQHVAALDVDLVEPQMLKLFNKASSLVLANITMDILDDLDEVEVYPSHIPDLSSTCTLVLFGRYKGSFPEVLNAKGVLADFSNFVINLKIQNAKDVPIERVFAREQIDYLTSQAWLTQNKQLEQKVAKLSLQTGFLSEYTSMGVLEIDHLKKSKQSDGTKVSKNKGGNVQGERMLLLPKLGIGFGNLTATKENTPPGAEETKLPDGAEVFVKAATACCGSLCNHCCCCMCCIQVCSKMNNQCATAFSQLCIGLGCYSCLSCCSDLCCSGNES